MFRCRPPGWRGSTPRLALDPPIFVGGTREGSCEGTEGRWEGVARPPALGGAFCCF